MTDDEWQAHATREAAKAVAKWLEARGRLHQPIARLGLADLEGMAAAAISQWIVSASRRIREHPAETEDLRRFLMA